MSGQKMASFRGQPLIVLGLLLGGWTCARIVMWDTPFPVNEPVRPMFASAPSKTVTASSGMEGPARQESPRRADIVAMPSRSALAALPALPVLVAPAPRPPALRPTAPLPPAPLPPLVPQPRDWQSPYTNLPPPPPSSARIVVGSNLLMLAGFSQMELPPVVLAYLNLARKPKQANLQARAAVPGMPADARALPRLASNTPGAQASRWSGDGWLLLRHDSTAPFLSGGPSYGRSQAGAVIRYRLAPGVGPLSGYAPQAYLRASSALDKPAPSGPRETEIAAGLSARPFARVPVRMAAELRVGETYGGTKLRPAAYAVSEFAPLHLPYGVSAEVYAQAGYVGGEFSTAFADGQMRLSKNVVTVSDSADAQIDAGAGVWGGAQKDAARLDIGPSAALTFRMGDVRSRLALDYRIRLAGDAQPASGPALTLSAGF